MRIKKRPDYGEISRRSIKQDMQRVKTPYKENERPERNEPPKVNAERRIIHISEQSFYAKYARYIVGKLVRIKSQSTIGGNSFNCEFVHDDDRQALNTAAGWSDNKREYLFDGVKFKN